MLTNISYNENKFVCSREVLPDILSSCTTEEEKKFWTEAKVKNVFQKLSDGIYEFYDVNNPQYTINPRKCRLEESEWLTYNQFSHFRPDIAEWVSNDGREEYYCSYPYGVCDDYHQILDRDERVKHLKEIPEEFIIVLCEIRKDSQPEEGGWRWCKWGEYIGDHKPTTEYLYDEEEISSVFVYNVYRVIRN